MSLQITHVHSPSDCDLCNRRTIAHSVPDLSNASFGTSPPKRSPTPATSPCRGKTCRTRFVRHRRSKTSGQATLNTATSLDLLSKRQLSTRKTDDFSMVPEAPYRRRVYTMPTRSVAQPGPSSDDPLSCYRLRSFSVTNRGSVVNLGDSYCFRSRSDVNVTPEGSRSSLGTEGDFRDRASSSGSTAQSEVPHHTVLIMGDEGVGKSSLIAQFMTSEYLTVRNALVNDMHEAHNFLLREVVFLCSKFEQQEKNVPSNNTTVSILLDSEEADLECIESKSLILTQEDFMGSEAILLVYSVTSKDSFRRASHCLCTMRDLANRQPMSSLPLGPGLRSKAVILVGNKSDLARIRAVSTEDGRSVANKFDVKFVETSVVIHHNVDELLVGILSQMRLKARQAAALSCRHHAKFTKRAKGLWNRLLQKCDLRFNSCDNLHL